MEKYEKIKAIAQKFKLSAEDKRFIEPLAIENGITINKGCSDCWRDAAIQLAIIYKPEQEAQPNACGYELRPDIDVTLHSYKYGTMRVCPALVNEENVKKWLAAGIPLRFFTKTPDNAGNEQD